ncbi:SH3 domain-containing protein [Candidatus Chloroploca sp. M-50]|uniref:SH3 domain-containing protein n=1 Tax=Candidatus Chloroploca mongolica TaxID=2528176 RepID=A0ABS4DBX9_9CHLR|nr:SH3 domain-containing protein [Candidatus Chloroploca mongolica]MBP1466941.1 SH3 domain-containing protein [Candidatus Chloroploca mongolica]
MYERGARDAEFDELDLFYYQHYYYYRQGYNQARKQSTTRGTVSPAMVVVFVVLIALSLVAGGVWWFSERSTRPSQAGVEATLIATATVVERPTSRPIPQPTVLPPAALVPEPEPELVLAVGRTARIVNLNGTMLRARASPGLTEVVARLPDASEVTLVEGPVEADGYVWWRVEAAAGTGWVAQGSPEGTVFLEPLPLN